MGKEKWQLPPHHAGICSTQPAHLHLSSAQQSCTEPGRGLARLLLLRGWKIYDFYVCHGSCSPCSPQGHCALWRKQG